jgi:hypothetical protein
MKKILLSLPDGVVGILDKEVIDKLEMVTVILSATSL